ncbi:hybrid sensor histidine kinase/response regulator [Anaeromassilibacillus senegalensis]|uniref:hybrid sensor histidine kinase/response regulator n=1 Tax=Anaeromassilibacillus senegalensis TaxID=1673717 RepID=UPI000A644D0A|nr:PAS domain-containing hybrid sensor histidine kinase/response regulator [Anaeromassilibacillus senegalensis]
MTAGDLFSMDQMTDILDGFPSAVFVHAAADGKLLYANRLAKDWFPEINGADPVLGLFFPCLYVCADEPDAVQEYRHPGSHRAYRRTGKRIQWAGRDAFVTYLEEAACQKAENERDATFEETLQEILSGLPCGLCIYQADEDRITPILHNQAFYEIMGYSEANIRSVEQETSYLNVHPEDLESLRQKIDQLIRHGGPLRETYRLWNDTRGEYRWIQLSASTHTHKDGQKRFYGIYSDVSEQKRLEQKLTDANKQMYDIINAIPGGIAIYKVSDIFETVYFSDGIPELSGYTVQEYRKLVKDDAAILIYPDDTAMVVNTVWEAIRNHTVADLEFRKQHRDGHIVWVRAQAKQIGEEDGCPLLHCVFHNISALKETQQELNHLVNSIPGGIASYRIVNNHFVPSFFSDGVAALSGHTREEYEALLNGDVLNTVYPPDRKRVFAAVKASVQSGETLDLSYRTRHKDGTVIWVHLNGQRIDPLSDACRFYAVFTGMPPEARLFQSIANDTGDEIYVIDQKTYELLYVNESEHVFSKGSSCVGQKCYAALQGKNKPCAFCTLKKRAADGVEHLMELGDSNRFFSTRFREMDWNGIPAYVKFVRDVTQEVLTRREKERLEIYFRTVVDALPGGVSVVHMGTDGAMTTEFISDGFATMTRMSLEEATRLYKHDALAGIHPDDAAKIRQQLDHCIASGGDRCELIGRLQLGGGGYLWLKSNLSIKRMNDGSLMLYSVYTDISASVEEKAQIRRQYENLLLQHYRMAGPNELVLGHCNITQNRILEILDYTNSDLLQTFGTNREAFFTGIASLVVDEAERRAFLNLYLNKPALEAFFRHETEQILKCFIKLPKEPHGRYVQFKVNLVETPDTGDITGVLTVTDITEQTISDRILHQLSVTSYDYVIDLNLTEDSFTVLTCSRNAPYVPPPCGCHSERVADMVQHAVAPKDRKRYAAALDPDEIRQRLQKENPYTISYCLITEKGDILTKNMTVSAVDLRLGRVCLVCSDITESVREEQSLLNMMAYTFERMGLLHISSGRFTMYTRQTVLENLSPYVMECYEDKLETFTEKYGTEKDREEIINQFRTETILQRLSEQPNGYDFVFPYRSAKGLRYKQINMLWGDDNHSMVCMVRADVTEMLAAERKSKQDLENALALAEEANRAKSDFLSAMSHDIRTPMNAIMGMTTLARAHLDNRERVEDCLRKISVSSRHLLSLVNDILDMSKIEQSKVPLNHMPVDLPDLIEQLTAIIEPQAQETGLHFTARTAQVSHRSFLGDALRINQILINLLSNAVKFTPEGGRVDFLAEEIPPVRNGWIRYRFTIRDTGIGMVPEFLEHVFSPFARGRAAAQVEGTGLGLSITKGLVELMGGTISVESQVGRGSTFRVELECEDAPRGTVQADMSGTEPSSTVKRNLLAGRTFLVVEDNAINAEILCELLSLEGAQAVVRTDGTQAVHAVQTMSPNSYDAILMDIQMPKMNGYEAARAIRKLDRNDAAAIPIIAMTANAFAEDIQSALDAGMDAHVAKPIDMNVLRAALDKVLQKR